MLLTEGKYYYELEIHRPGKAVQIGWGDLEILERLGAGAFGEVFAFVDSATSERFAVKRLSPALREPSASTLPACTSIDHT